MSLVVGSLRFRNHWVNGQASHPMNGFDLHQYASAGVAGSKMMSHTFIQAIGFLRSNTMLIKSDDDDNNNNNNDDNDSGERDDGEPRRAAPPTR